MAHKKAKPTPVTHRPLPDHTINFITGDEADPDSPGKRKHNIEKLQVLGGSRGTTSEGEKEKKKEVHHYNITMWKKKWNENEGL